MTTAHEPRRGPGTHLSVEDLSALAEGAEPSAAGAAGHLLECAACRGEVDAMSDLLAQFEEWDAPPIPRDVAIRIDAALARESAARAATAGHPAAVARTRRETASSTSTHFPASTLSDSESSDSESPDRRPPTVASSGNASPPRRRRWRPAPGLSLALATLVLIAGGLGLILKFASSGGQTASNSAASGSAATTPFASQRGPALNGANSGPEANGAQSSAPLSPALHAASSRLAAWTDQALSVHKVDALLASPCLDDPAFVGKHALAVANGNYNGSPATLVVYTAPSDLATVIAVVYAAPCATNGYRVLDSGLVAKPIAATSTP